MTTIPRAELNEIAERYNDTFDLSDDPQPQYARDVAEYYRSTAALIGKEAHRSSLFAEADELDALADRYEGTASA